MPKMKVFKLQTYRESLVVAALNNRIASPAAAGCFEFVVLEKNIGALELLSENKFEDNMMTRGGQLRTFNGEVEHQAPDLNPNEFPLPHRAAEFRLDGGFVNETVLGRLPAPNSTWTSNMTPGSGQEARCYDTQGVAGFQNPGTGGIIRILADAAGGTTEVIHYGSHSSDGAGDESFSSLGRNYGGPNNGGGYHYGYDYRTNPTPPPATILDPVHAEVQTYYPNRALHCWMSSGMTNRLMAPMPVPYAPKGSRCGIFMPVILRFLAFRRRRSKSSSSGVVNIHPINN
jgi:hypothetical protein